LTLKGINICLLNKLEIPGLVISKSTSPVDYQRNDRFATHFSIEYTYLWNICFELYCNFVGTCSKL